MGRTQTLILALMVAAPPLGCASARDFAIPLIVAGVGAAAVAPVAAEIVAAETGYDPGTAFLIGMAPSAFLVAAGFALLQLTETSSTAATLTKGDLFR